MFQVTARSGRQVTKDQLLGNATTHEDGNTPLGPVLGCVQAVFGRELLRHAQRRTTRNDGHAMHWIGAGNQASHQRVTSLVIGRNTLLFFGDYHRLALWTHQDFVLGLLKVAHLYQVFAFASRQQGRFVYQRLQICTGKAWRTTSYNSQLHIATERYPTRMHSQDAFATFDVGTRHHDATVKATWPQQRGVQDIRSIGGGDHDHAFVGLKPIHLDQQLVQGLLSLVVTAAKARASVSTDCIDLVDEDNAGRVTLALLKQVAYAAGTDTDEHLHKVAARDAEKWDACFTGNGTRQQGLACARRPHHQHALGNAAP